jgi:hypothetical protein
MGRGDVQVFCKGGGISLFAIWLRLRPKTLRDGEVLSFKAGDAGSGPAYFFYRSTETETDAENDPQLFGLWGAGWKMDGRSEFQSQMATVISLLGHGAGLPHLSHTCEVREYKKYRASSSPLARFWLETRASLQFLLVWISVECQTNV